MGTALVEQRRDTTSPKKLTAKGRNGRVHSAKEEQKPSSAEKAAPESLAVNHKSRISSKGQITLPLAVRERLGVRSGDQVEFRFDGEQTVVLPVRPERAPLTKWIGIAKGAFKSHEELLAWDREMRGWDEWDYEHYK